MVCICGHDDHAWSEPTVCTDLFCKCEKYVEATPENPVDPAWQNYVNEMNTVKGKIVWLLQNVKFLRNYPNKLFVDWFRTKVYDADPETIRRTKQKLVEDLPGLYAPFEAPELDMQKQLKQVGIEEWIING